jgi:adenosylcobinamide-GDP ribazoletransferase
VNSNTSISDLQTAIRQPLRSFLTAVGFLTIVPTGVYHKENQIRFGAAQYYFPIVGLCIGLIVAAAGAVLNLIADPLVTAVFLALLLSSLSGFLHMDGLADTADGFLSARNRERCLEIMKDSRIGVMGAVALGSIILLKTAAIYSIAPGDLTGALIVAAGAGRTALVVTMYFLPYARAEGGLGLLFRHDEGGFSALLTSLVVMLVLSVVLLPLKLMTITCIFVLVMIFFSAWCYKKIGGYTGDTLGCLCELMETALLLGAGLTW